MFVYAWSISSFIYINLSYPIGISLTIWPSWVIWFQCTEISPLHASVDIVIILLKLDFVFQHIDIQAMLCCRWRLTGTQKLKPWTLGLSLISFISHSATSLISCVGCSQPFLPTSLSMSQTPGRQYLHWLTNQSKTPKAILLQHFMEGLRKIACFLVLTSADRTCSSYAKDRTIGTLANTISTPWNLLTLIGSLIFCYPSISLSSLYPVLLFLYYR